MKKIFTVVLALLCFVNISYFSVKAEENYVEPTVEEIEARIDRYNSEIKHFNVLIKKTYQKQESLNQQVSELNDRLAEGNRRLQLVKNDYNKARAVMLEDKAALDEIASNLNYATKKLEYLEVARKNAIEKLKEREVAAKEAEAAYEKAKGTEYEEVARAILEVRMAEVESAAKDVKELEAKLVECKKEIDVLQVEKDKAQKVYEESAKTVEAIGAELDKVNYDISLIKRRIEVFDVYAREMLSYQISGYNKYINLLNHEIYLAQECREKRLNEEPIYNGYLGYWDALEKQNEAINKAYYKLMGDEKLMEDVFESQSSSQLAKLADGVAINAVEGMALTSVANVVELSDSNATGSLEIYEKALQEYAFGNINKVELLYNRNRVLTDFGSYSDELSKQVYLVDTFNGVLRGIVDPTPTPAPKKDESCEKVKGPTWHWNNTKGVCEEVAVVGTSAR